MTQATAVQPALQIKTCSVCPHFDDFHEESGRGWCELFNYQAREYHQITDDCINSSESIVSHELVDNLALFPNVDLEELDAFPTEEREDKADLPHAEYEVGSIVKVIDAEEDHIEWGVFEVVECRYNQYIYDPNNPEAYLNHVDWYYRLASNSDSTSISKSLWVAENEICDFDMAHNVCTEDIF